MSLSNIFLTAGSLACLLVAFACFGLLSRRFDKVRPALIIYFLTLSATAVYALSIWNGADFISSTSPLTFIAPLLAALPLTIAIFRPLNFSLRALLMFGLSAAIIFGFDLQILFFGSLPMVLSQLLAAVVWTVIGLSLRLLNGQPALVAGETLSVGLGVLILSLIGAAPFALGFWGAVLAACSLAFLFYNWYPSALELKNTEVDLLGFILGGLAVYCGLEGAASPAFIFITLLLCEAVFALGQKLTFLPAFADTTQNTAYNKAIASGLNPSVVAGHMLRINILLLLFGCFQVYAPNPFSIPLVCVVITAWQLYRLVHWNTLTSGLKETNSAVVTELKKNLADLKNNFNKTDKPD